VFSWSGAAIRKINEHGYKAIVITNQSGVGRGYFDEASVEEVHGILRTELAVYHAKLDAIYACIHHPEAGCDCRKPHSGMLLRARDEMNIDLTQSFVIGDKYLDVETAHNVGAKGILVLTGYGRQEQEKYKDRRQPDLITDNLMAAVDAILEGTV
jgi:D-glycero-D-manno-heptose 1,7-bisphosphate phosphatase